MSTENNQASPSSQNSSPARFPMVGLGASAGGLEALKQFFSELPEDSGMAFIVVVHMSPKQPTMMPELLQRVTRVPVSSAKDSQAIAPDHIYVTPSDKEISIYQGKLQLLDVVEKSKALPIDIFLRSLAQDQGNRAAAVILSGTGTDGTLGVKAIKDKDGLVFVQSETSAAYDGMPRSAISTGLVDMVMTPAEMPKRLIQYFDHSRKELSTLYKPIAKADEQEWLHKVFAILRTQTGHDFSAYKVNTLLRRIHRRMGLNQIESHDKYIRFMRENPAEVEALFRELLIGVTNFFRDKESFEVIKNKVIPQLFESLNEDATFRAWIPGCSTGEEAYSLAMVLRECLDNSAKRVNLQLFGTDIDSYAIEKAREGLFPASISADLSQARLKRFFTQEGDFYRIRKDIRDCIVFSVQDLLKDPPFLRLDMLCCRNVLIYLEAEAQKRLLPLFHYTLNPGGVLVLGSSETIGGFSNLFDSLDKKWKIFKRREVPQAMRHLIHFPIGPSTVESGNAKATAIAPVSADSDISQQTRKAILDQFAPTAVLIDANGEILYVQGRTGKYLETPSGPPTRNLLELAREGLRIELSSALRTAKSSEKAVIRRRVAVKTNGGRQLLDLHVAPQHKPRELAGRFLVAFQEIDIPPDSDEKADSQAQSPQVHARIAELEKELQITRESHQTTIEELESSNEELKSTNEELQSANEELQSTNEELESSKEELQSLNEELQTVNAELQSKVEELSAANDDMRNLLNSTQIATIFVDNAMQVRRFTPEAAKIINLIQTDIGRPLQHVVSNLAYEKLISDLEAVLGELSPREAEVQTQAGEWYHMRIMPYRTTNNRIDGAVLTFASIDDQKQAQAKLRASMREMEQTRELFRTVFDMHTDPMAVVDADARLVIANTAFSEQMDIEEETIENTDILTALGDIPEKIDLRSRLKSTFNQGNTLKIQSFEVQTSQGKQRFALHGRVIQKKENEPCRILLHFNRKE